VTAADGPGPQLGIESIDSLPDGACRDALAPLFEGAPRFLSRLCAARPYGDADALFARAREIAHAMPEPEQLELIDAHPRLGAPPGTVSAMSFVEQGYDREAADAAAEVERERVGEELRRLNEAYERRFGFRYCVYVAGRPRSALLAGFEAALAAERGAEIARALDAVVDIAVDRYQALDRDRKTR
jgi:2-oxo-4-hydroxy-4-carboxy--5-ureidoimidazoline (OHCU) decarboxylase